MSEPVAVVRSDEPVQLTLALPVPDNVQGWRVSRASLNAEDGSCHELGPAPATHAGGRLRVTLPGQVGPGYYRVQLRCERPGARQVQTEQLVIVAPKTCTAPEQILGPRHHGVGVGVDLFAARSEGNFGVGDFRDLAALIDFGGAQNLAYLGLPPLHAVLSARGDASPYNPLSRLWLSPIYIDITKTVSDYASSAGRALLATEAFAREAQRLRELELVDFAGVFALKISVLRGVHADLRRTAKGKNAELWQQVQAYQRQRGDDLTRFSGFVVLREQHAEHGVHTMPAEYSGPEAPAFKAFVETHHDAVEFVAWLQFETERQLSLLSQRARAVMPGGLYLDLAVGTAPDGYEPWARPEMFLSGASAGAPPDYFNPNGQRWGFPPFDPRALGTQEGVLYFRDFVRANMRYAGILRIDHAFGLRRMFVIPEGASAKEGAYAQMPEDVMLAVIALESTRHRTIVIGEDLGLAPEGWRDKQREQGILGYDVLYAEFLERRDNRVLWPEPTSLRRLALATPSLHDTPPFRSLVETAEDSDFVAPHLLLRRRLNLLTSDAALADAEKSRREAVRDLVAFLRRHGWLAEDTDPGRVELTRAMARYVGAASNALKMWRLADLGAEPELSPVNVPGIGEEYPSFRVKMRGALEGILADPETGRLLMEMKEARSGNP